MDVYVNISFYVNISSAQGAGDIAHFKQRKALLNNRAFMEFI